MEKEVYLGSNKQIIQKGEEVEILAKIKDFETVAYNLYIYFDDDIFEFVSGPENTNVVSNYVISVWHDINGGVTPKTESLGKFIFKAKKSGISEFTISGNFYDTALEEADASFEKVQIKVESKEEKNDILDELNSNLEMLAIENVMITPLFDNNITNYEAQIGKDEINLNILAIPENEKASVKIYGNENLKEGNNLIRIVVNSSNNSNQKEYKINVYKRSQEEEIAYKNEEELNKQKLESFYNAEKISYIEESVEDVGDNTSSEIVQQDETKSNVFFVVILIIVIIGIIIIKKLKDKK